MRRFVSNELFCMLTEVFDMLPLYAVAVTAEGAV